MFRRIAIAALWFVAFLCVHELAWSVFGSPRILGFVIGLVAAAFFYFDPARLFTMGRERHVEERLIHEGVAATH